MGFILVGSLTYVYEPLKIKIYLQHEVCTYAENVFFLWNTITTLRNVCLIFVFFINLIRYLMS